MKIILGIGIGASHPQPANAWNELTCSPRVLLEFLEQRMGLSGIRPGPGRRIAAYRLALERHLNTGSAFYAESFSRDPFAVAETLLGWRDELLMHGLDFNDQTTGVARVECLRAVEAHFDPACRCGEAERLRDVTIRVADSNHGVEELRVTDPEEWLPPRWRALLSTLAAKFCPPVFEPLDRTDLGRFQRALLNDDPTFEYRGDGSIEFITAYSEAVLARAAAQYIVDAGPSAAMVDGDNLQLVDHALRLLDAPICGAGHRSPSRPIPQLLNLVLQLQWRPFDPQRLLDFLVHPESPVSGRLRHRLAKAVIAEPGTGGTAWNDAIASARAAAAKTYADSPEERDRALQRIDQDLTNWLAEPGLQPDGAEAGVLADVAERLAEWAKNRARTAAHEGPMFHHLHSLATEFATIIREQPTVTRAGVERLLRQLTGNGTPAAAEPAELGHVPVVSTAGAIAPVDTVLWWNFAEPTPLAAHPWTREELAELARHKIHHSSGESLARNAAEQQLRPILAARKKLVFFKPRQREGEEVPDHPLWTRLMIATRQAKRSPEPLNVDERLAHPDADGRLQLIESPGIPLPRLRRWLALPKGTTLPTRQQESFSSLRTFVHSPFEWVCRYAANLFPGNLAAGRLAVDARLQGQLVHRLVEVMFPPTGATFAWQDASNDELDQWIDQYWPVLLRQEGATLLLPGYQGQAASLRTMAARTLQNLIAKLRHHSAVNVIADHQPAPCAFEAATLGGRIDLCYETVDGTRVVVDLKFGGHEERQREVRDNTALQLAVYGRLLTGDNLGAPPKSAFYIITRRQWVTGDGDFFGVRPIDRGQHGSPDMHICWEQFRDVWQWRRQQLNAGRLEVTFSGAGFTEESTPPHAAWGPLENEGRYSDHVKLAGWKEGA